MSDMTPEERAERLFRAWYTKWGWPKESPAHDPTTQMLADEIRAAEASALRRVEFMARERASRYGKGRCEWDALTGLAHDIRAEADRAGGEVLR